MHKVVWICAYFSFTARLALAQSNNTFHLEFIKIKVATKWKVKISSGPRRTVPYYYWKIITRLEKLTAETPLTWAHSNTWITICNHTTLRWDHFCYTEKPLSKTICPDYSKSTYPWDWQRLTVEKLLLIAISNRYTPSLFQLFQLGFVHFSASSHDDNWLNPLYWCSFCSNLLVFVVKFAKSVYSVQW